MLEPILHKLTNIRIVLASSSPRRMEICKKLNLQLQCISSTFEENLNPLDFPTFAEFVEETALQKVLEVEMRLPSSKREQDLKTLFIGADTIVSLNKKVYGKPKTQDEAIEYLTELSGKVHTVYTGVILKFGDHITKFTETAEVKIGNVTQEQILAYVNTGEPMDKAGAYGIQGAGGTFVESINGDFFTVVGLPCYRLCVEILKIFNYEVK